MDREQVSLLPEFLTPELLVAHVCNQVNIVLWNGISLLESKNRKR